jgi:quinol-cytochrome oxidoreductase complex cytochrome b subunit
VGEVLDGGLAGQAPVDLDHCAVAFVASIGAAFTGYLSQQNFASQWIASEGKDGLNAAGVGAFFNVLNFGQMFMWHILLLPLVLGVLVVLHVLLVRKHGVVPPFAAKGQVDFDSGEVEPDVGSGRGAVLWEQ